MVETERERGIERKERQAVKVRETKREGET